MCICVKNIYYYYNIVNVYKIFIYLSNVVACFLFLFRIIYKKYKPWTISISNYLFNWICSFFPICTLPLWECVKVQQIAASTANPVQLSLIPSPIPPSRRRQKSLIVRLGAGKVPKAHPKPSQPLHTLWANFVTGTAIVQQKRRTFEEIGRAQNKFQTKQLQRKINRNEAKPQMIWNEIKLNKSKCRQKYISNENKNNKIKWKAGKNLHAKTRCDGDVEKWKSCHTTAAKARAKATINWSKGTTAIIQQFARLACWKTGGFSG